ncbi:MAG: hypothetical protein WC873_00910 [Candidatus Gracilibacteria bacterium]
MKNLSDERLYERCKYFGKLTLNYRNKFIGLLPEVNRRKLYEQKGFSSIFEFAFKLAGLSKEQVQVALNLDLKFADKPDLKEIFESGKASISKLARIVSIATVENQEFLANQVQLLPKSSLETLARDIKNRLPGQAIENQNGLFETQNEPESVHVHSAYEIQNLLHLKLSAEVIAKLSELQNKGLDINELILEFLKNREEEIENEKIEIVEEQQVVTKPVSRYIPSKTKKILQAEHGTKCAITHCKKPAKAIHHTARFALSQAHNPRYLAPLCHEHHLIAHSIDQNMHTLRKAATP